jgi:predicted DNA-binding transcriptional regulator AlpA
MLTIRVKIVAAKLGVGVATVWRLTKTEEFPKPFKLSEGVTVWDAAEIEKYLFKRKKETQHGNSSSN